MKGQPIIEGTKKKGVESWKLKGGRQGGGGKRNLKFSKFKEVKEKILGGCGGVRKQVKKWGGGRDMGKGSLQEGERVAEYSLEKKKPPLRIERHNRLVGKDIRGRPERIKRKIH